MLLKSLKPFGINPIRSFATNVIFRNFASQTSSETRKTLKKLDTRKTYLMDSYTRLMRENPVVLVLHNGTLLKAENNTLRAQIKKIGGKLVVTRSSLFNAVLRGLEHSDPASKEANKKFRYKSHPLSSLFKGPTAVITISDLDPKKVESIVKIIDKTNERLILLGGQVDGTPVDRAGVDHFKTLPSIDQLRADLAGVLTVLGGAGLVQTLETSSKMLYLTLDSHRESLEGDKE